MGDSVVEWNGFAFNLGQFVSNFLESPEYSSEKDIIPNVIGMFRGKPVVSLLPKETLRQMLISYGEGRLRELSDLIEETRKQQLLTNNE